MKVLITYTGADRTFRAQFLRLPDDESPPVGIARSWIRGMLDARRPIEHRDGHLELRPIGDVEARA